MFQQHQDESIYDAWTRFKNLIQRVPHHGLDLLSLTQFFYDHVDDYTRMDLDFAADGNLRELSGEEAWEAIENFAQGQKEWDNPPNIISEQEVANLKAQAKRLFGNENVWVEMHRGIPIEVEPLDETPLEDLGLNTCNHDIPLSSREIPSIDEPEPQPQPLPNCLSLNVSLGEERGPEPLIKPHSPDSFRMKEVDSLTINTPPSPHVASSHPKDTYCYYCLCINDPKKHYGFKPGLLGKSASLGVDISNWEMFDDDWGLESKDVSPLEKELSLFNRPNKVERGIILEAHRLEPILQQQISQRMDPSHHDGNFSSKIKISFSQTVETTSRLTRDAVTTTPVPGSPQPRRRQTPRLYLMRRSLEVLKKFHWMILEGQFNQLSHISSSLLSKPGEY
ncbi:hypothetical protein Tco_1359512 [Tanacetum coccineum]